MTSLEMSFFGVEVSVKSDVRTYTEAIWRNYQRFAVGKSLAEVPNVNIHPRSEAGNPYQTSLFIHGRKVWSISNRDVSRAEYVEEIILNAILARIQRHFLIHAGVVSRNGQGIILAADSGHGKTTLVLELIRRGCKFLSDEVAALGLKDGQVYPFPRALMIKRPSLGLAGYSQLAGENTEWRGKLAVDIEKIQPGCIGSAVPVRHIVILQDPVRFGLKPPNDPEREVSVLVDRLNEGFLDCVRRIPTVAQVRVEASDGFPLLKLRTTQTTSTLSRVEALCEERGIWVLDIIKRPRTEASFAQPARLEPIPKSQAVLELLRRFQGGYNSALLRDICGDSASRLFRELAATIRDADCYRLFVGPLPQMADLVGSLASADECETSDSAIG